MSEDVGRASEPPQPDEARTGSAPPPPVAPIDAGTEATPSGRRMRVAPKIPDDRVPPSRPESARPPPVAPVAPVAAAPAEDVIAPIAPMRIISLDAPSDPLPPVAATEAPATTRSERPAQRISQLPPAPGTQGNVDPGWTPAAGPVHALGAFAPPDIEELAEEDVSPDSADSGDLLLKPPPPRPPSTSRPDGMIPPPPPPRPPSVSRPDLGGLGGPSSKPASSPKLQAAASTSVRPPPVAPAAPVEAETTADEESAERLSGPDVEEIYVSLGDTATEEPPGLAAAAAVSAPPAPPPKTSTPAPPPAATSGPASTPAVSTPSPASAPATSSPAPSTQDRPDKKRVRPWWEEVFDDDMLRTMDRLSDKQTMREALFLEDRLGLQKGAIVLDLACGAGRHAVELTRRGYKVVGYDLSLAMLARASDEAEEASQKINFLHGDMREMAFDSMFDGVYSWGTSFGYFEEEKNFNVLQRVRKALRPGGVFLLDILNRDYVACRQPSMVWFEGDGCVCMDEMSVDFITSRLKVKRTVMLDDGRTREIDYSIRLYGLHELGKMLHDAGFKVLEVSGQMATPGVFFGSESPRCIVLAERALASASRHASAGLRPRAAAVASAP